jgi:alkanesulfonate monooxygenase SsuD/methylene tetrahydromethanopterin reductase-like flavin-dependent oxidoreductase (luciferase family)
MRIRQMEEAVRLILAMWTKRRTTFHGRYFHVSCALDICAYLRLFSPEFGRP